jgi:hypothetical protein
LVPAELKQLSDLNRQLLWANLELLRNIKEYCAKNGLPDPALDDALAYRVKQTLDLTYEINEALGIPSDGSFQTKKNHHSDDDFPVPAVGNCQVSVGERPSRSRVKFRRMDSPS